MSEVRESRVAIEEGDLDVVRGTRLTEFPARRVNGSCVGGFKSEIDLGGGGASGSISMGVGDGKLKPDAYKGNHGGLTSADAVVPIAFGYPGWTGTSDTTFSQLKSYLTTAGAGATEAEAMRVFLFRPRP